MKKIIMVSILLLLCSKPEGPDTAGNATKTGNAFITGKLINEQSEAVSGAEVYLFDKDYRPVQGGQGEAAGTTDSAGNYIIDSVESGEYNIEGKAGDLGAFIKSIAVSKDTTVAAPTGILRKHGKIKGVCYIPGLKDTCLEKTEIYLAGTGKISQPDTNGNFELKEVAEGYYLLGVDPHCTGFDKKYLHVIVGAGMVVDLDTIPKPRTEIHIQNGFDTNRVEIEVDGEIVFDDTVTNERCYMIDSTRLCTGTPNVPVIPLETKYMQRTIRTIVDSMYSKDTTFTAAKDDTVFIIGVNFRSKQRIDYIFYTWPVLYD